MRCSRSSSRSPTARPCSPPSSRLTITSAGLTSWSTTPATGSSAWSRSSARHEARAQIETNLFGALWVTQAALPYLREQRSGHILQVSSIGGISAFPGIGMYHASKWALEGISQALAQEVKDFGINVTLIEPGGFSTDWGGAVGQARRAAGRLLRPARGRAAAPGRQLRPGDPGASAEAVLRIVDAEQPPLRAFFGKAPLGIAEADYESRLANWREWQPVAELAHGD